MADLPHYINTPQSLFEDDRLNDGERLLLGLLIGFTTNGKANRLPNSYFAKCFKRSARTMQDYFNKLEVCGYIKRVTKYEQRYIRVIVKNHDIELFEDPPCELSHPPCEIFHTSIKDNNKDNNKENIKIKDLVRSDDRTMKIDDIRLLGKGSKAAKPKPANQHFVAFYNAYPRKESKQSALKAYEKAEKEFLASPPNQDAGNFLTFILDDLARRSFCNWKGRPKNMIPLPATYLNGKQWEGEIIIPETPLTALQAKHAAENKARFSNDWAKGTKFEVKESEAAPTYTDGKTYDSECRNY